MNNFQPSIIIPPAKVLTIAGSDSGGAAGLQADLRAWAVLGAYGMCAITAVTAQNSRQVKAAQFMPADFVSAQLDAVLSDYGADAVKTGFLGQVDLIATIAAQLQKYDLANVVIDPVLANHKGQTMFAPEVTEAYINHLFPLADLVTPNRREAEMLTGLSVRTAAEMETAATMEIAARHIHALGPKNVLIKGGRKGDEIVDVFYDGNKITQLRSPYIETPNTHGSGDTLSAAVCYWLAKGEGLETAVRHAHQFTAQAIQTAVNWKLGGGHGPVWAGERVGG
ncbi:MAG: bifunctional hydroxymethylpyrimidine kinase/phosphomethylpyrimidine kinase [Chloroflexi bacterium]|nr:bifunctional hydroxymethylpyrimidine kinase/phosphomethylpyrimidine kinase [Chloroflexota bacterium]